ncbi:hypothetical protein QE152_g27744 [Popillia japonica]|uniref:Uncharacterized protein n=1 Tax=Popillia japonica TaxID=7064 RepID=A0AAW1JQS7_POPJA
MMSACRFSIWIAVQQKTTSLAVRAFRVPWLLAQNFCVPVANRNCIVGIVVTGPDVHTGRARFWLAAVSIRARTICLCTWSLMAGVPRARFWLAAVSIRARTICLCTWSLMAGVPIVSVAMKGVPNCGERSLLLPLISDLVASVALRTLQVSVGSPDFGLGCECRA